MPSIRDLNVELTGGPVKAETYSILVEAVQPISLTKLHNIEKICFEVALCDNLLPCLRHINT